METKRLIRMIKSLSPHEVVFTADEDPHFVIVEIRKRATGEVKGRHMILKSDLAQWVCCYESDGFTIVETNNE